MRKTLFLAALVLAAAFMLPTQKAQAGGNWGISFGLSVPSYYYGGGYGYDYCPPSYYRPYYRPYYYRPYYGYSYPRYYHRPYYGGFNFYYRDYDRHRYHGYRDYDRHRGYYHRHHRHRH